MSNPCHEPFPRFLPLFLDKAVERYGDETVTMIPVNEQDPLVGYRSLSLRQVKEASDRIAWWLEKRLGDEVCIFSYCGKRDIRWSLLLIAAMRTGRTLFSPSLTNTLDAMAQAYIESDCYTLLFGDSLPEEGSTFGTIQQRLPHLQSHVFPSAEVFLDGCVDGIPDYAYGPSVNWLQHGGRPAAIFQSAGTTGPPKLVRWSHQRIAHWLDHFQLCEQDPSLVTSPLRGRKMATSMSFLWHAGAQILHIIAPIYYRGVSVYLPALQPPTMESLLDVVETSGATCLFTTPVFLQTAVKSPKLMKRLGKLEHIQSSGAMLDRTVTEAIMGLRGPTISNAMHVLENSPFLHRQLHTDPRYLQFDKRSGVRMEERGTDTYEMVVIRHDAADVFQPVFDTFPDLEKWSSHDLFKRHPDLPDFWRFCGRANETVLLSNLYTIAVAEMQHTIEGHHLVRSAIIGGDNRSRTCLLLEPLHMESLELGRTTFVDQVWPSIEEANALSTSIGQIHKSLVHVALRPFPRGVKGHVHRSSTLALFEDEIDHLYQVCGQAVLQGDLRSVVEINMGRKSSD